MSESPDADDSTLARLHAWLAARCETGWERRHALRIYSLDTPGWGVEVDLEGTGLESRPFETVNEGQPRLFGGSLWIYCHVDEGVWIGGGDPSKLDAILRMFLDWAEGD